MMTFFSEHRARVYLDHAATSWPKPPCVLEAANRFQWECGASAGRGAYESGMVANRLLLSARRVVAEWIGAKNACEIAFTSNGTMALNAGLLGLLRPSDHVVSTLIEHNSVLRPLVRLAKTRGIAWHLVSCNRDGLVDLEEFEHACEKHPRLVIVSHASNVTGAIQPIDTMSAIARRAGSIFFVDAAQTAGHVNIDVQEQGIDLLAFSGHKGCYGLLGTGVLYLRDELAEHFDPPWIGGTGTQSDRLDAQLPWNEALESGNLNLPAIASLKAGIEWLQSEGAPHVDRCSGFIEELLQFLLSHPDIEVLGPRGHRVPVISIRCRQYAPQELASILDTQFGIEVRAGLHCAPLIHDRLGTAKNGGTVRISPGATTQPSEINYVIESLKRVL